jgi:hypothetical protein
LPDLRDELLQLTLLLHHVLVQPVQLVIVCLQAVKVLRHARPAGCSGHGRLRAP